MYRPISPIAFARKLLGTITETARLAVGVPDYARYAEHRKLHHPGEVIMSYEEFFMDRQRARYKKGTSRCC
jgi:uncharacterized short protein YbdD (DUF466 family)